MKPSEYVKRALETESNKFSNKFLDLSNSLDLWLCKLLNRPTALAQRISQRRNIRLLHAAMGVVTEVGELFEMLDKPELDLTNLREECGDAFWYCAIIVDELGWNLEELMIRGSQGISGAIAQVSDEERREKVSIILAQSAKASSILLDVMKKSVFYGKAFDSSKFKENTEELIAQMMILLHLGGFDIEESFDINIAKLQKKRFKGGKFSEKEAIVRNLEEERKTLEGK